MEPLGAGRHRRPAGKETWRIMGKTLAILKQIDFLVYDDTDYDGYVPDGATKHIYIPFYSDIYNVYIYNKWD